jgi:hypothetical protein
MSSPPAAAGGFGKAVAGGTSVRTIEVRLYQDSGLYYMDVFISMSIYKFKNELILGVPTCVGDVYRMLSYKFRRTGATCNDLKGVLTFNSVQDYPSCGPLLISGPWTYDNTLNDPCNVDQLVLTVS